MVQKLELLYILETAMSLLFDFYFNTIYLYKHMTKNELKNIIKGLIVESINESTPKGFPQKIKKKVLKQYPGKAGKAKAYATMNKIAKNLNEEDEMEPVHPQDVEQPGEVESPEVPETAEEHEHAELLAQIDSIIGSLNSLKSNLLGHAEGEEVSDENEMGEEEVGGEEEQA